MSHNSNPDEIYRQKAAPESAARLTLWLFPELKSLEGPTQRSALAEAARRARKHWTTYVVRFGALALWLASVWAMLESSTNVRNILFIAFFLAMLTAFLFDYLRTRTELRAARDRA